jgi:hypothetical protein
MPKLPIVGEVKPAYLYAGGATVVVIVGYAYWKKRSTAGTTAAAAAAAAAPAGTSTDATIDPNTGIPYADETGSYGSSYGGIDPATGVPFIYESGSSSTGASQYTSNQQWADAAIGELENTFGYAQTLASSSVGDYMAGKALPPDEYKAMQLIIAELGPPPTGTFSLKQGPAGTPTPTGNGRLIPGEVLRIPYNVQPGQAGRTAAKFGISLQHLLSENPGLTGHETVMKVYTVPVRISPSMTLDSLARDFGISVTHLLQYVP